MENFNIRVTRPEPNLVARDILIMRDRSTGRAEFRASLRRLTEKIFIKARSPGLISDNIVVVPILRAGLWMLEPVISYSPNAPVGFIGTKRNEETAEPMSYLCRLPLMNSQTNIFLLDVMLATGGSACDAIRRLKEAGAKPKNIRLLSIFAARPGIGRVNIEHPEVEIVVAQVDDELDAKNFIVPGCGDAGDRACGT